MKVIVGDNESPFIIRFHRSCLFNISYDVKLSLRCLKNTSKSKILIFLLGKSFFSRICFLYIFFILLKPKPFIVGLRHTINQGQSPVSFFVNFGKLFCFGNYSFKLHIFRGKSHDSKDLSG